MSAQYEKIPEQDEDTETTALVRCKGKDKWIFTDGSGKKLCRRGWFIWGWVAIVLILLPIIGGLIAIRFIMRMLTMGILGAAAEESKKNDS